VSDGDATARVRYYEYIATQLADVNHKLVRLGRSLGTTAVSARPRPVAGDGTRD
jgi:hypothetical protein